MDNTWLLGALGSHWGAVGTVLRDALGDDRGPWGRLAWPTWANMGHLGANLNKLGANLAQHGSIWGQLGTNLGQHGPS